MKLSVIMPAYNEEASIREIIKKVQAVKIDKEIIIVDDGSTDKTREILTELSKKNKEMKVVFHKKNGGKSTAVRTGIEHATGDIIIIQDADLEYDPEDYYKLVEPIVSGKAKVVYGSRFYTKDKRPSLRNKYFWGTRTLTIMANVLYGAGITDEPTCYKVFDAKVLKSIPLKSKRFEFCPEVTAKVRKRGYKIHELPINYYPRTVEEGKKINWKDGVEAVWTLIKYRFVD
ncbi:MAG: glycosyltransferase family 2 protein [Nanoarchaeota archaeon]|nr:glycosyltransferase family 2 protein [Nanoarchaeota archaeon]